MSRRFKYGTEPHEQLAIGLARKERAQDISIPYTRPDDRVVTATFCGTCGRIVHHPDCPRAKA